MRRQGRCKKLPKQKRLGPNELVGKKRGIAMKMRRPKEIIAFFCQTFPEKAGRGESKGTPTGPDDDRTRPRSTGQLGRGDTESRRGASRARHRLSVKAGPAPRLVLTTSTKYYSYEVHATTPTGKRVNEVWRTKFYRLLATKGKQMQNHIKYIRWLQKSCRY